jgi:PAT family acetyl-CoA transporter-like MFS transporter 1
MSSASSLLLVQQKPAALTTTRSCLSPRYDKDFYNICFLMFLYLLQGVPIGLLYSLPFILSARNVSYADQGTFSFAGWPYSMKLLWAPVVDSVFSHRLGRRKSWLVPVQYLIGACMLFFADYVHMVLEASEDSQVIHAEIYKLTGIFFLFTFLAATQDVAVDGWGLTMLSK